MNVCVYCASSNHVDQAYFDVARATGRLLAERGHTLVYGGGNVGLMGALAKAVHDGDGTVLGVIPEALQNIEGVAYELADELIITRTMAKRKHIMYTRAEAFLVLPGGFGTLEEFMEVLTLRSLGYHHKPLALLNAGDFYAPLLRLFEHFYQERFARTEHRGLYHVAVSPDDALAYLEATSTE